MNDFTSNAGPDKPTGRRFGCLLQSMCILAVVLLVIGLGYFIWYSNASSELDAEISKIASRGEPLWFSDFETEPIDPEDNGAELYFQALEKMQAPSQAFLSAIEAPPAKSLGEDPVIVAELARNREVLDLVRQAVQKPFFRLPRDYQTHQPYNLNLHDVQAARDLARLLQGDAQTAIVMGDQARAVEAIDLIFGLSELLRDEPITITQLVRFAIGSMAQGTLKSAAVQMDFSPQEFAVLDERLATIESRFTLVTAMQGERAMAFTTMNHLDENIDLLADSQKKDARAMRFWSSRWLQPNLFADQAFMLKVMNDVVEVVDKPGAAGSDAMQEIQLRVENAPKRFIFSRLCLPNIGQVRLVGLRYRQKFITARLGLRVHRYFAEHGKFPASLAEITDDRLPTVPVDLFSGKPLVYKVLPDGFVIYPVGENGIDDGGSMKPDYIENVCNFEVHYPQLAPESEPSNESLKP